MAQHKAILKEIKSHILHFIGVLTFLVSASTFHCFHDTCSNKLEQNPLLKRTELIWALKVGIEYHIVDFNNCECAYQFWFKILILNRVII